jgi:nucleotide-binding universal stress UspA family protein
MTEGPGAGAGHIGSVSSNVAEHASCPVLVIHGDQAPPA